MPGHPMTMARISGCSLQAGLRTYPLRRSGVQPGRLGRPRPLTTTTTFIRPRSWQRQFQWQCQCQANSATRPPFFGPTRGLTTSTSADASNPPAPGAHSASVEETPDPDEVDASYKRALHLLTLLPTNKRATSLFTADPSPSGAEDPEAAATTITTAAAAAVGTDTDTGDVTASSASETANRLNAASIPEMRAWLARAGYTPADIAASGLRCVHVAGTKGKGTVSALVTAILVDHRTRGAKEGGPIVEGPVGTYMSPHVVSVRERIMLDGKPVSRALFTKYFFELWERLARSFGDEGGNLGREMETQARMMPFFFRFLTLLAFHTFVREGVKSAVVECGIGGEYDATTAVLAPEAVSVAVVCAIGIDHVAMLGETKEEIAWHKTGVFKPGVPAVVLVPPEKEEERESGRQPVLKVFRARAAEREVEKLVEVEVDVGGRGGGVRRREDRVQRVNQALAAAAAGEHLWVLAREASSSLVPSGAAAVGAATAIDLDGGGSRGKKIITEHWSADLIPPDFQAAMEGVRLRGRHEVVEARPDLTYYLDGAHTVESLEDVGRWFVGATFKFTYTGHRGYRALIFNQQDQERDAVELLKAVLRGMHYGPSLLHSLRYVALTRNESDGPLPGEEGQRDLTVQRKAAELVHDLGIPCEVFDSLSAARAACEENSAIRYVLVTGSFHLVGSFLHTPETE